MDIVSGVTFPSLSGKTSIRTPRCFERGACVCEGVSIPFREDLYSDEIEKETKNLKQHPVSIPFREDLYSDKNIPGSRQTRISKSFHPFQGRPPFGRVLLGTSVPMNRTGFHPFQGRPPFGLHQLVHLRTVLSRTVSIPFREDLHSDFWKNWKKCSREIGSFHPFQGRPLFGQKRP